MRFSHPQLRPLPIVLALQAVFALPVYAADFTIGSGVTNTTAQSLTANNGVVQQGGTLATSGTAVAVTVNAGTSTINNSGTISQTGSTFAIDANTAATTLTINNNVGALINAAGNVTIRINKATDGFVINNQGTICLLYTSPSPRD